MPGSGFATSDDAAYTSMVAQLLPHGIRGVVACGMLASLIGLAGFEALFSTRVFGEQR
jgi:solute:Na+ symporter, SSS family